MTRQDDRYPSHGTGCFPVVSVGLVVLILMGVVKIIFVVLDMIF